MKLPWVRGRDRPKRHTANQRRMLTPARRDSDRALVSASPPAPRQASPAPLLRLPPGQSSCAGHLVPPSHLVPSSRGSTPAMPTARRCSPDTHQQSKAPPQAPGARCLHVWARVGLGPRRSRLFDNPAGRHVTVTDTSTVLRLRVKPGNEDHSGPTLLQRPTGPVPDGRSAHHDASRLGRHGAR